MPAQSLLIDIGDPQLENKVAGLAPTPGYCIFIDVVGSTAMKQQGITHWVALIHNAFSNAGAFLSGYRPLKGIGDELMYFIEEADMKSKDETPLQIFDGLYQVSTEIRPEYPATKICAAYCASAYPMTFLPGTRDYYGIDIDRAARLKSIDPPPQQREIVIDGEMYLRVKASYDAIGNKSQFKSFSMLKGPRSHTAKGILAPISVYRTIE